MNVNTKIDNVAQIQSYTPLIRACVSLYFSQIDQLTTKFDLSLKHLFLKLLSSIHQNLAD